MPLSSPTWWKDYCKDDSSVTANFTSTNVSAVTTRISNALKNLKGKQLTNPWKKHDNIPL